MAEEGASVRGNDFREFSLSVPVAGRGIRRGPARDH